MAALATTIATFGGAILLLQGVISMWKKEKDAGQSMLIGIVLLFVAASIVVSGNGNGSIPNLVGDLIQTVLKSVIAGFSG